MDDTTFISKDKNLSCSAFGWDEKGRLLFTSMGDFFIGELRGLASCHMPFCITEKKKSS
jgi:hypothetical protein